MRMKTENSKLSETVGESSSAQRPHGLPKGLRAKCDHKVPKSVGSSECTEVGLAFDSRQQLAFDETRNTSQKRFVQITKKITNITVV